MTVKMTAAELSKELDNPVFFALVNAWVAQKAIAVTLREKVEEVWIEVLTENPVFEDMEKVPARFRDGRMPKQILSEKYSYQLSDSDFEMIFEIVNKVLVERGIKPESMKYEYCPALVAEEALRKISHEILDLVLPLFGLTFDSLWHNGDGVKTYNKMLDLCIGCGVNHPNFVPVKFPK